MKVKLLPKTEKVYGTKKVGDKHLGKPPSNAIC